MWYMTSNDVHIQVSKSKRTYLMDFTSSSINRQIINLIHLYDDMITWCNNSGIEIFLYTIEARAIDVETLYDELMKINITSNKKRLLCIHV